MAGFATGRFCRGTLIGLASALSLAACDLIAPVTPVPIPPSRPAGLVGPVDPTPAPRSAASQGLANYYLRVQNRLLTRGLLRTDGGGPDTPFGPMDLVRNFETLAFSGEYAGIGATRRTSGTGGLLNRWSKPVRVSVEFGSASGRDQRARDRALIAGYIKRLGRVTGHPIAMAPSKRNANFRVFIAGEDDGAFLERRLKTVIPQIRADELAFLTNLPRSVYCLMVAFASPSAPQTYSKVVVLIRAEHPNLVRQACIHEEIAQGLGLANDSLQARPSIFNDDDEFALLTTHDEHLLRILYDPRLRPGMTAAEARPVTQTIAQELLGLIL